MNAIQDTKSGSSIEQQLGSVILSQRERNAALHAAGIAEVFVETILWACSKVERPNVGVFAKTSPKY
jgi:hypothetical protein